MKRRLSIGFLLAIIMLLATFSPVLAITFEVEVDIAPLSDPNPLNWNSKGVLPVAILGSGDLDVTDIYVTTVMLEGVCPLRWAIEDVAGPGNTGPDGYPDLTLKFNKQEVIAQIDPLAADGDIIVETLTGNLLNSIAFWGNDTVVIIRK
jgi:hypothetical protein